MQIVSFLPLTRVDLMKSLEEHNCFIEKRSFCKKIWIDRNVGCSVILNRILYLFWKTLNEVHQPFLMDCVARKRHTKVWSAPTLIAKVELAAAISNPEWNMCNTCETVKPFCPWFNFCAWTAICYKASFIL